MTTPARVVKWRPYPSDNLPRLILKERTSGRPLAEQEARLDFAIARWEWADAFGRMWRHIGRNMQAQCSKETP